MDYHRPHGVLLFFEQGDNKDAGVLTRQKAYYEHLSLLQYIQPVQGPVVFISLAVQSDDDFARIIDNDPALQADALRVVQACPFLLP